MQARPSAHKRSKSKDNSSGATVQASAVSSGQDLPRRFGRLTLLKHLARGGMGEVYLATAGGIEGAERPCVVKIIRREHAEDRSFLARFLDEARIQAQLHHPGVAQVLEAATDEDGKPYVVIEHVEGRNLGEVRHRASQLGTSVAWPDAVAIGVAITDALAHVHERTDAAGRPLEIVHRDLSPQNVMMGYGGDVKLIDFGTARGENRRCHTVAGVVFAKPGYVAPEVANNTPGGAPADLYAVGVILWELLAGRRFLAGEPAEHLAKVAAGERKLPPLAGSVDAPHELDAILAKLTAHKIANRYASARDAMSDLVALLKRAPACADGERSVRVRIQQVLQRLYPAEPSRTRAEFARLVALARQDAATRSATPPESPAAPQSSDDQKLLSGTRYELCRELGRGAMGTVYEARHRDLGRRVALKVLALDPAGSAARFDRFRAEARAIAQIRHANLVTLYDFGMASDGRPYYAMELLEGETLDRVREREGGLYWRQAVRFGVQAALAIEAAHAAGVVHRDIKPANLFVTEEGVLKLLDFGIAKQSTPGAVLEGRSEKIEVYGTPEYMAPEQALGAVDERSDVYGLGCVLYELLTGSLPFDDPAPVALLEAKKTRDPESVRRRAPQRGIPKMLDKTIQRAIARDPEKRTRSAAELREELEAALREPLIRRQRRRQVGLSMVATATVVGVVGFVVGMGDPGLSARLRGIVARVPGAEWVAVSGPAPTAVAEATPAVVPATESDRAENEEVSDDPDESNPSAEPESDRAVEPERVAVNTNEEMAGAEEGALETEAESTASPAAEPQPAAQNDELGGALAEIADLADANRTLKAYDRAKRLGRRYPKDPRVLEAWSRAAVATKSWGEAYRVAWRWAQVDDGLPAQLHLAQMQRRLGRRSEAVTTLKTVLKQHPDNPEARSMLEELSPRTLLALQERQ